MLLNQGAQPVTTTEQCYTPLRLVQYLHNKTTNICSLAPYSRAVSTTTDMPKQPRYIMRGILAQQAYNTSMGQAGPGHTNTTTGGKHGNVGPRADSLQPAITELLSKAVTTAAVLACSAGWLYKHIMMHVYGTGRHTVHAFLLRAALFMSKTEPHFFAQMGVAHTMGCCAVPISHSARASTKACCTAHNRQLLCTTKQL